MTEKSDYQELNKAVQSLGLPRAGAELRHSYPRIIACSFSQITVEDCSSLFKRTYSTGGLSYTFNSHEFWSMYKGTEANQIFYDEIHGEMEDQSGGPDFPMSADHYGPGSALEVALSFPLYQMRGAEANRLIVVTCHSPSLYYLPKLSLTISRTPDFTWSFTILEMLLIS